MSGQTSDTTHPVVVARTRTAECGERSMARSLAIAAGVAILGPVVRAASLPAGETPRLVAVLAPAVVVVMAWTPRPAWLVALPAAAASALLWHSQGDLVSLWVAWGIVAAPWVALGRPPVKRLTAPGTATTSVVVGLGVAAAWLSRTESNTWQVGLPVIGQAALLVLPPKWGELVSAVPIRFGRWVGRLLSTVLTMVGATVVAAVVITPAAPLRWWLGSERGPGWARRSASLRGAARHLGVGAGVPRGEIRGVRAFVTAVALGALVIGVNLHSTRETSASVPFAGESVPRAFRSQPDFARLRRDLTWVLDERVAYSPFELYRLVDVHSDTVNVDDGYRRSARPPGCDCRRLVLWLYGGDAAFGLGQRDEHTVASELSDIAAEHGMTLDVSNRGLPDQTHWRAATRFANDVSTEDAPDLAVFLVGQEEVEAADALALAGDPMAPPSDAAQARAFRAVVGSTVPAPSGARETASNGSMLDAGGLAEVATRRFRRDRSLAEIVGRTNGIPVLVAWQPVAMTGGGRLAASYRVMTTHVPRGDVDVTRELRSESSSDFDGAFLFNERGARRVAAELFVALDARLRAMSLEPTR